MQKVKVKLFVLLFLVLLVSIGIAAGERSFKAKLSGGKVVPPVKTTAKGEAIFRLSKEGNELTYKLTVTNIENVTAAHIHEGKYGKNGPPIVSLFTGPKKEHEFTGKLAEGTITAKDLKGSLKGKLFSHFIQMIEDGHAYVNVHSETHPDGEIRGQIKP
ncbi:MAG TPA: CHRD domain-containing protein [Thermodesulfovibrionales bacterium]|nr:CHRD domain-containing protein [Thermodesulfovibrionales bacterium]